ncbi:hypothetical protein HAZT_HAZT007341 [Hyalella azteca]|uniref:FAM192A/Fyv6 N-terminal domain-containing protein n=1 Tax=Hyalella azteca TaxID=294128 RepID=A0A6A0H4M3_HYAAZ|nr:hypothetical protein HAZT_HAZT007341 [Hyalella azteca]
MSNRFISESDIEAKKKILKEAWNLTKREGDPEEPPEEPPVDNRTLYHRLEEQRLRKQEEYEDAHRLKNMVRGLEDDEIEFLEMVDRTKMEQEKKVRDEESSALSDFRKRRAEIEMARASELVSAVTHSSSGTSSRNKTNSQKSLLSAAIKRKGCDADADTSVASKDDSNGTIPSATNADASPDENGIEDCTGLPSPAVVGATGYLQCVGTLPGLGNYTDSSDSMEDSTTDSDEEPVSQCASVRHKTKSKKGGGCGGGGCC